MTNETTKKVVTEYRLHINGIWGRNRKPQHISVLLVDGDPAAPLDADTIRKLATEKSAEMKVKCGSRLTVIATPTTVENHGNFTSRSFMMFSGAKVFEMGV